jgi:hypothetical protein
MSNEEHQEWADFGRYIAYRAGSAFIALGGLFYLLALAHSHQYPADVDLNHDMMLGAVWPLMLGLVLIPLGLSLTNERVVRWLKGLRR